MLQTPRHRPKCCIYFHESAWIWPLMSARSQTDPTHPGVASTSSTPVAAAWHLPHAATLKAEHHRINTAVSAIAWQGYVKCSFKNHSGLWLTGNICLPWVFTVSIDFGKGAVVKMLIQQLLLLKGRGLSLSQWGYLCLALRHTCWKK